MKHTPLKHVVSKCGSIDKDLGNKNIYNCKHCNIDIKRDYNGAINILLRYVTKYI